MAKAKRRRKPESLKKFEVRAKLSNFHLAKAKSALRLEIYARGIKAGELQVGRGSLYWSGHNRKSAKRVAWGRFAEMMDHLAYDD
ncbi:MAG TPA: hypothetical protein VHU43_03895 [Steroidobacteraceae bacterium]|nr:hypothetical protein [Steroidobacteraceae bacterium]